RSWFDLAQPPRQVVLLPAAVDSVALRRLLVGFEVNVTSIGLPLWILTPRTVHGSPRVPGRRGASPLLLPFPKVAQHIPSGRHYFREGLPLQSWVTSEGQRTA